MITDLVTMRAPQAVVVALLVTLAACGGSATGAGPDAPSSPAAVDSGDGAERAVSPKGKRWSGWRYNGARDACFFVVGRTCFETEDSACAAAACADGTRCATDGAGPATVSCK